MSGMFRGAAAFSGDMSKWDLSTMKNVLGIWYGVSFNGGISKWDVSSVTRMKSMFWGATSFNDDLSQWDVSSVANMDGMFREAWVFNGDISKWDVSSVTDMGEMFQAALAFEVDISKWDVSKVRNMYGMFQHAVSFDVDISKWDVSRVRYMDYMFLRATSFKQELCGASWIQSEKHRINMFVGSSGSLSPTVCAATTRQHTTRRPLPDVFRELILRTTITTSVSTPAITSSRATIANVMTCPKCGTFGISGRVSCCAPGGAWFKNCGGTTNRNVAHRWSEGVEACKCKFKVNDMWIIIAPN